jgi:hypothetical protein
VLVLVNTRARPVRVAVRGVALDGARDLLAGGVRRGETLELAAHQPLVLELR